MTDNEMMIAVIGEINNQLTNNGITDFQVSRNQQPTTQYTGADKDDDIKTRVFLHAITNPTNWRSRKYQGDTSSYQRVDIYHKSKTIQASIVHYFDFRDVNSMTTEDMANRVRDLLDSPDAIKALRSNGVYLESVGDVRPVFQLNDKDQTESLPNFDIIVNYQSTITKSSGYVDEVIDEIDRV